MISINFGKWNFLPVRGIPPVKISYLNYYSHSSLILRMRMVFHALLKVPTNYQLSAVSAHKKNSSKSTKNSEKLLSLSLSAELFFIL